MTFWVKINKLYIQSMQSLIIKQLVYKKIEVQMAKFSIKAHCYTHFDDLEWTFKNQSQLVCLLEA